MPTITPTVTKTGAGNFRLISWAAVATGDTCTSVSEKNGTPVIDGFVTITGTFNSTTAVLQGSNDNTNWFTLEDHAGTAISVTAAGAFQFSSASRYIRGAVSGGTTDAITFLISAWND